MKILVGIKKKYFENFSLPIDDIVEHQKIVFPVFDWSALHFVFASPSIAALSAVQGILVCTQCAHIAHMSN